MAWLALALNPALGAPLSCDSLYTRLLAPKITARESAALDRAVLRDFEDLEEFAAPSKAAADAWNARVIRALEQADLPKVKEPGKAALTTRELIELTQRAVKNDVIQDSCRMDSRYEKDPDVSIGFCFGRAVGVHLLARMAGLSNDSIRKFWLVGEMKSGDITWSHHVATGVRGDDKKWYVIDPATTNLLPLEAWLKDWQGISTDGKMTLFATKADRFGPGSRDPLFESTTDPDSYNGFFHDLFASARREGEDVAKQLTLLSQKGSAPAPKPRKPSRPKPRKRPGRAK